MVDRVYRLRSRYSGDSGPVGEALRRRQPVEEVAGL